MADFESPSFSLGLDFETQIVDDSDPEDYSDPNHKPNHLFRTRKIDQNNVSNVGNSRRFQVIDIETDTDEVSVSDMKCNVPDLLESCVDTSHRQCNRPPAYRYFFNCDVRIQELVRTRLCHFSPLSDGLSRGLEQLDYMGQFGRGESSKQHDGIIIGKKSLTRTRVLGKVKNEESLLSPGWVNPKLGVGKVKTKLVAKKKVRGGNQSPGKWLTGSDGKKVYVGKNGQELTGRVAYMRYKKENGSGFKKRKCFL